MQTFIISFLVALYGFCVLMLLIVMTPSLYLYFMDHGDYVKWKYYIKNADSFKYKCKFIKGVYSDSYVFEFDKVLAYVWVNKDGCSIHDNRTGLCIVGTFYKKPSKKMAKLLMKKIPQEENET